MIWAEGWTVANNGAEMGKFLHACEGEIVCESVNVKIPYFNAPIYLENKVCSLENLDEVTPNASVDPDRKSRRDPRPAQPSLLHYQAARGYSGELVQRRRQVLHWWG
jgi:hypothetical protein